MKVFNQQTSGFTLSRSTHLPKFVEDRESSPNEMKYILKGPNCQMKEKYYSYAAGVSSEAGAQSVAV